MPKKTITTESVPLSDIQFDEKNANIGTDRGLDMIEDSIRDFGFIDPGVLDGNNKLMGGNKRTKAASEVGHDNAIIIDHDGESPIYIRYKQFDLNSPDPKIRERSRRLAYALNRTAQISLKWDATQLEADLASGLDLSNMFEEDELSKIIANAKAIPNTTDAVEPSLVAAHIIQIYCDDTDLDAFLPTLKQWMEHPSVTINIA